MKSIDVASPSVREKTRKLLADCGLPFDDVNMSQLQHFLVIIKDDRDIVGVVGLEALAGQIALLRSLAVHESHRKQGLASQLVEKMEAYARSTGIRGLYLLTLTAGDFFRRRGYQDVLRGDVPEAVRATNEFQSACPESAACMVKYL